MRVRGALADAGGRGGAECRIQGEHACAGAGAPLSGPRPGCSLGAEHHRREGRCAGVRRQGRCQVGAGDAGDDDDDSGPGDCRVGFVRGGLDDASDLRG